MTNVAAPTTPRTLAEHAAAADALAAQGRWEDAYRSLRAAVRLVEQHPFTDYATAAELARLRREHAEAREQSRRDCLTATYNRRYLDERLVALLTDPAVTRAGLSLALVDADHFKLINDTHGHLFGDQVLCRLVEALGANLPEGAFCARYGGEEFALVLPGHSLADAVQVCEAARARVAGYPWTRLHHSLRVTVSIGVVQSPVGTTDVESLIREADVLLYAAKQAGRNAVAYRAERTGLVQLAGAAAGRRAVPQLSGARGDARGGPIAV